MLRRAPAGAYGPLLEETREVGLYVQAYAGGRQTNEQELERECFGMHRL